MTSAVEKWNSLPRILRGGLIFGLGASAASILFLGEESAPHNDKAKQQVSYAVGVVCASKEAQVSYFESADGYKFHCTVKSGDPVDVTEVQNLDVAAYQAGEIHGYNKIVPLTLSGEAIGFDFQGPDGVATIYTHYVNNSGYNHPSTGIARVTN
jgi:hypothetical protein